MSIFPVLKTGAVAQYPSGRATDYSTEVLTFVDGSEQRFRQLTSPAHRWIIRLDLLDEAETAAFDAFVASSQGRSGSFAFVDPWDDTVHPDCSFQQDDNSTEWRDLARGRSELVVVENRT